MLASPTRSSPPSARRFIATTSLAAALVALAIELLAQPLIHARDVFAAGVSLALPALRFVVVPVVVACTFGVLGAALALPAALALRWPRCAGPARYFTSFAVAAALLFHIAGLAYRYTTGVYATPSAVAYFLDSPVQLFAQLLDSYPSAPGLLLLALALSWLGVSVASKSLERRCGERRLRLPFRASWAGAALLALPLTPPLLVAQDAQSVEVAMYAQALASKRDEALLAGARIDTRLEGAPQSTGTAYREELARLAEADVARPNVLLLMLESVPASRFGYAGYERNVTPNIDRLARAGLRAPRAWATATHSNYAQMAVLSSLVPRRGTGLDTYRRIDYPRVMPQDLLSPLGYATATISSQNENWQGMRRFQQTATPHYFFDSHDYHGPKMGTSDGAKNYDHVTVDEAIAWLSRPRSEPFYLYVNLQQTHFDYTLPPGVNARFPAPTPRELRADGVEVSYLHFDDAARAPMGDRYDSVLAYVDVQVGRLYAALERLGVAEDTIVVVTADHGESFGQHGIDTHGKSLREPEARVPLLIHYPKGLPAGVVDAPVSHVDIMPTVLDLLGLPPYPGYQGASFLDAARFHGERRGIFMTIQGLRHADAVVCYPWKLVHDRTGGARHLYDLARDPHELRDLIGARGAIARTLTALLEAQIEAQLIYHGQPRLSPTERFAPRLGSCPELPAR